MTWRLIHADCLDAMSEMDEASVDAIVCDPPYGLEFMGKEWDRIGRRANHRLDPSMQITRAEPEKGNPWASEASGYGAPKKNPRCRRCSRLRFDHEPRRCRCDAPDWDTRTSEYARELQTWHAAWATEALRVLKPGAHLLAFGGTRTYHRLACALEDAGFEIRDTLCWLYGSGFPKSLDVSKAIDKAYGAAREVVGTGQWAAVRGTSRGATQGASNGGEQGGYNMKAAPDETAPATPEALRWAGWGTALKPAFEPIVLARKPLVGSVATNVERFGTGALNIDGARIGDEQTVTHAKDGMYGAGSTETMREQGFRPYNIDNRSYPETTNPPGRWPANVVLDPEAAALLDAQTGELGGGAWPADGARFGYSGGNRKQRGHRTEMGDTGGASRFFKQVTHEEGTDVVGRESRPAPPGAKAGAGKEEGEARFRYVPKADREERNRGLDHLPLQSVHPPSGDDRVWDIPDSRSGPRQNPHPTVKPVELMRWLCRLITPPGGTILDPFTGSGSTGIAALREGFDFIGIEREADYVEIARARIQGDAPLWNVASEVTA